MKKAAFLLAFACLLPVAANAKPPLDSTDPFQTPLEQPKPAAPNPGHVANPPSSPPIPGVGSFQRLPSIDESKDVVLVSRKKPYWQAGTFDPDLSNACALGDFDTAEFNRMVIRFTDPAGPAVMQVVVPTHRHLLYDPRHLAKPGLTYFFLDNHLPTCRVWIEGKVTPGKLDPSRGTSLPQPRAKALADKKKAIANWPQE